MLDHFSGTTKYNLPYWLKRTFVDFYSCTTTIQFHLSVLCYVCVFDFAVSPPGGFPDHPHRGSYSILTTHLIMIIIIYNFIALLALPYCILICIYFAGFETVTYMLEVYFIIYLLHLFNL